MLGGGIGGFAASSIWYARIKYLRLITNGAILNIYISAHTPFFDLRTSIGLSYRLKTYNNNNNEKNTLFRADYVGTFGNTCGTIQKTA
jgi:hypothetical protein